MFPLSSLQIQAQTSVIHSPASAFKIRNSARGDAGTHQHSQTVCSFTSFKYVLNAKTVERRCSHFLEKEKKKVKAKVKAKAKARLSENEKGRDKDSVNAGERQGLEEVRGVGKKNRADKNTEGVVGDKFGRNKELRQLRDSTNKMNSGQPYQSRSKPSKQLEQLRLQIWKCLTKNSPCPSSSSVDPLSEAPTPFPQQLSYSIQRSKHKTYLLQLSKLRKKRKSKQKPPIFPPGCLYQSPLASTCPSASVCPSLPSSFCPSPPSLYSLQYTNPISVSLPIEELQFKQCIFSTSRFPKFKNSCNRSWGDLGQREPEVGQICEGYMGDVAEIGRQSLGKIDKQGRMGKKEKQKKQRPQKQGTQSKVLRNSEFEGVLLDPWEMGDDAQNDIYL